MNNRSNFLLATLLIVLAAASRIVNTEMHLWNFAPVAALGLFSGAVVKDKRLAFLFTLLAQLLSDTYFQLFTPYGGFYGISQFFVYGAMTLVTALGTTMGEVKPVKVGAYAIGASLIFFVVSNFGVWADGMYGRNLQGLVTTYEMAIPFYKNTLGGDLIYSAILFGVYALATRKTTIAAPKASI